MPERNAVLITGAAKRLGAAIARHLARAGWDIALHYGASEEQAMALARDLEADGARCVLIQADLADRHEVEGIVRNCIEALGRPLDALVNNAALFSYDTIQTLSTGNWERTLAINVTAPMLLARDFAAMSNGTGCIVNLLDQKLYNLNPDYFSYTVSKLALEGATRLLARALAPLRVCAVAPGITFPSDDQTEEEFEAASRVTPLRRSSGPEDVARTVQFLLESPAITGQIITVDGGQHLLPLARDVMFLVRDQDT